LDSQSLLDQIASDNPHDLFRKMAKATIADRQDAGALDAVTCDVEARGQPVVLRHLAAMAGLYARTAGGAAADLWCSGASATTASPLPSSSH
jgi:hypothetical protein